MACTPSDVFGLGIFLQDRLCTDPLLPLPRFEISPMYNPCTHSVPPGLGVFLQGSLCMILHSDFPGLEIFLQGSLCTHLVAPPRDLKIFRLHTLVAPHTRPCRFSHIAQVGMHRIH